MQQTDEAIRKRLDVAHEKRHMKMANATLVVSPVELELLKEMKFPPSLRILSNIYSFPDKIQDGCKSRHNRVIFVGEEFSCLSSDAIIIIK